MNKEFIPYKQALELKELGFDEKCFGYYVLLATNKIELVLEETSKEFYKAIADSIEDTKRIPEDFYTLAPLYQQAFRWFREKYGLYSEIFVDDNKSFGFLITSFIEEGRLDKPITRQFNSYEEAELGCVKQLIEIIDRKAEAYS